MVPKMLDVRDLEIRLYVVLYLLNFLYPPLKKRNGRGLAESETEQAEEFNGQFINLFSKTSQSKAPLLEKSAPL